MSNICWFKLLKSILIKKVIRMKISDENNTVVSGSPSQRTQKFRILQQEPEPWLEIKIMVSIITNGKNIFTS